MFTGIVEEVGSVERLVPSGPAWRLEVACRRVLEDLGPGDSIAVAGVCLTVVARRPGGFVADVMRTTIERTTLGRLHPGSRVNLERALRADSRLGGHFVLGHVDWVGTVRRVEVSPEWRGLEIALPPGGAQGIVPRGSVAVDGVSLTVAEVVLGGFIVRLVPYTLSATTLGELEPGSPVNVETDVLGKYVLAALGAFGAGEGGGGRLSVERLREEGY